LLFPPFTSAAVTQLCIV